MLEQFVGVGYLATVVSRLIGLTIVAQRDRAARGAVARREVDEMLDPAGTRRERDPG